jgi:hypothetical protein
MAGIWILICQAITRKAHTIHTVSTLLRTLQPEGFDSYEEYTFLIAPPLFAYLPNASLTVMNVHGAAAVSSCRCAGDAK